MIKIKSLKVITIINSISIVIGIGCNNIPNNIEDAEPTLYQYSQQKTYKIDSLLIFNICNRDINHVVDFSGSRVCTLSENSSAKTTDSQAVYYRISCLHDTILTIGGTTYGIARFKLEDIFTWKTLHKYMKSIPFINLTAKLILNQLSEEQQSFIIDSCDTITGIPDTIKSVIIEALNVLLGSSNLYHDYKTEIESDVYISYLKERLYNDVRRLVDNSIMLDTTGTVNTNLNPSQVQALRWFNWKVIVRYMDAEEIAVDYGKVFLRYPSDGRVYTMLFQQGQSQSQLHEKEILRFLLVKSTSTSLLAYKDEYGLNTDPLYTHITDYPFMCDTSWTIPILFWRPEIPFIPKKYMPSLMLPGKAVLKYTGFERDSFNLDSSWIYNLNLYYPMAGEIMQNGEPVRIVGSMMAKLEFYKTIGDTGLCIYQGYFRYWNTEIDVQAEYTDGKVKRYQEKCFLKSDDGTQM